MRKYTISLNTFSSAGTTYVKAVFFLKLNETQQLAVDITQ